MRTITLRIGEVRATAALDGEADLGAAFWSALPIETELLSANWSGHACTFPAPPALLAASGRIEPGGNDVPVGRLAVASADHGGIVLVAYGTTMHHTALGPAPVAALATLGEGRDAFLARIERLFDEGAARLTIERA